jgi:hypothetical protein
MTATPMHDDYPVGHDVEVRAITKQVADVRQLAAECVVNDPKQVEWASALLGEIAKLQKTAEARRVWFVGPLDKHVKSINLLFKSIVAPLVEADKTLRYKVLTYRETERRRVIAEQERIRAAAALAEAERVLQQQAAKLAAAALPLIEDDLPEETGPVRAAVPVQEAQAPAPPAPTVRTALGTTTARRIMDFELTDISLVPKQFLLLDETAIRIAIRQGLREMPGIRIYEREILAVRTGA